MTNEEIDRKLATECMGWTRHTLRSGDWWCQNSKQDFKEIQCKDWSPSTNIAQAFECLDKLEAYVNMMMWSYPDTKKYRVQIYSGDYETDRHKILSDAESDTPAMAICLAILAAIEKGKPDAV